MRRRGTKRRRSRVIARRSRRIHSTRPPVFNFESWSRLHDPARLLRSEKYRAPGFDRSPRRAVDPLQSGRDSVDNNQRPDMQVGLIGDYNADAAAHRAIPLALEIAAARLGAEASPLWIPTESIDADARDL